MKYITIGMLLLTSCSTVGPKPRGCPELDSRASCVAAAKAERNML